MIPILILAAGASRRMGGQDKLLRPVDDRPLLRRGVMRARATGAPVIVTLPGDDSDRRAALAGLKDLTLVAVTDAAQGMAHSLAAGIAALPAGARGVLLCLADMPDLETADLAFMLKAFDEAPQMIHRAATARGAAGHPVAFPADLFSELKTLQGDTGARAVLKKHAARVRNQPLAGARATTDLDTPQDWENWENARGNGQVD